MLHPPRVGVRIVERRELFADRAAMWPGACAGFRNDPVAGGTEGRQEVGWDEVWDEDVALVVVGRFEGGLGDAHYISGQVEEGKGTLSSGRLLTVRVAGPHDLMRLDGSPGPLPAPKAAVYLLSMKPYQN